jgi:IS5 family transposase
MRKQYRIRNWREYNKALVNRGSLTVWFDEKSIEEWHNTQPSGQRGRPYDYSDTAIICALTLRNLYRMPLRATEGFISSLIDLLNLPITAPDYTTLCRRQSTVELPSYKSKSKEPIHLVVDSSGIKIYGEGEWKMRLYGKEKRRTWRKLHIAVNEKTHDIVMSVVTHANVHDTEVISSLLPKNDICLVNQVTGDGAYDTQQCYAATVDIGAKPCFPPRSGAARNKPTDEGKRLRNHAIGRSREWGLKKWKVKNNYHRRSMAETAFLRLKKILGASASSRKFDNQVIELTLRCHILNKMTQLGMPDSIMI